ncbi:MAG: hypothetical protein RLY30_546 [Pseudomonadota bacterium]
MGKSFDYFMLIAVSALAFGAVVTLVLLSRLLQERRTLARLHREIGQRLAEIQAHEQTTRERDRVRQRLIGALSHDLRQPIQAMNLYLRRLEQGLVSSWSPDSEREAITQARRGLQYGLGYMSSLLDGVLDVSQLMQGSLAVRADAVSVQGLLGRLNAEQGPLFREQGGRLELFFAQSEEQWILTDERLLERLIRNLLSNALRHAPGARVRMKAFQRFDQVFISVSDTGPGIPKASRDRVRSELESAPTGEMNASLQGVGLGLVIVRQIAIRIGARIALSSHLRLGTSFMVCLPVASRPSMDSLLLKEMELEPPVPTRRSLVTVISESAHGQHALRVALMSDFREVHAYRDASAALSDLAAQGVCPQLLVVDVVRGAPNPIRVAEQFESEFNDWIPTIILSDEDIQVRLELEEARWIRALKRPYGPEQLDLLASRATESHALRR